MTEDQFWRQIINGLSIEKDLIGDPVFVQDEEEKKEELPVNLPEIDLADRNAAVLRFKLDLYIISPVNTGKAYMVTGKSQMEDAGVMTVREALKLIERRKKR